MTGGFIKFPRTPHLFSVVANALRDDRVFSETECEDFLASEILVEEKVDGANVGLSVEAGGVIRAQNRGSYIQQPSPSQFEPLWPWIAQRRQELAEALGDRLILFGEWCFAVHSIRYDRLPDWFIGFDVYDSTLGQFWSADRRDILLRSIGVSPVRRLAKERFTVEQLRQRLRSTHSAYGEELIEGLYLRNEQDGWLRQRAKIVRPDFIQTEAHWSSRPLEKNRIR